MHVKLCKGHKWAYAQIMQHTHMHKGVIECAEVQKLLSHQRQSDYSLRGLAIDSLQQKFQVTDQVYETKECEV